MEGLVILNVLWAVMVVAAWFWGAETWRTRAIENDYDVEALIDEKYSLRAALAEMTEARDFAVLESNELIRRCNEAEGKFNRLCHSFTGLGLIGNDRKDVFGIADNIKAQQRAWDEERSALRVQLGIGEGQSLMEGLKALQVRAEEFRTWKAVGSGPTRAEAWSMWLGFVREKNRYAAFWQWLSPLLRTEEIVDHGKAEGEEGEKQPGPERPLSMGSEKEITAETAMPHSSGEERPHFTRMDYFMEHY